MKAFTFSSGQIIGIDWDNAICNFFEMTNDGILGKILIIDVFSNK